MNDHILTVNSISFYFVEQSTNHLPWQLELVNVIGQLQLQWSDLTQPLSITVFGLDPTLFNYSVLIWANFYQFQCSDWTVVWRVIRSQLLQRWTDSCTEVLATGIFSSMEATRPRLSGETGHWSEQSSRHSSCVDRSH